MINTSPRTRVHATASLKHLLERRGVSELAARHGSSELEPLFLALVEAADGLAPEHFTPEQLTALLGEHLVCCSKVRPVADPRPWRNVSVLNFELTYGCNLSCGHCHQSGLRVAGEYKFLSFEVVERALRDGVWMGLTRDGVNFTGGEVFVPGSPVLQCIQLAAELGCRVRCNTNAFWGDRKNIHVGEVTFSSDEELIVALRDLGLSTLALSLDDRYSQYPGLLRHVQRVASLCERAGLGYEFVATDADPALVNDVMEHLRQANTRELVQLQVRPRKRAKRPGIADTTDLGAAAGPSDRGLDVGALPGLVERSGCAKKGFTSPQYLHINPEGGVRSCLLAPGSASFGTVARTRLPQLLNAAAEQAVVKLFRHGDLTGFVSERIAPFRHLYRDVSHPCAASALLARVAAEVDAHAERLGRDPTYDEQLTLHRTLARTWNLEASPRD